jgi:hypothetical protein
LYFVDVKIEFGVLFWISGATVHWASDSISTDNPTDSSIITAMAKFLKLNIPIFARWMALMFYIVSNAGIPKVSKVSLSAFLAALTKANLEDLSSNGASRTGLNL